MTSFLFLFPIEQLQSELYQICQKRQELYGGVSHACLEPLTK